MNIETLARRVKEFAAVAHKVLGQSEVAPSRVVTLTTSYKKIGDLSVKQDDLLRQSLRCIEDELFRAAHVLAWAALVDYLEEYAARDGFAALNAARPKWSVKSIEGLREEVAEYNIIEGMQAAGLVTKNEKKALHGLLNRRNECAHPSDYYPDLNQSLGYVSEIIDRFAMHQKRVMKTTGAARP
jgi:hypothetical protein